MNLFSAQYWIDHPVDNFTEIFGALHDNPLGISPLFMVIFIFLAVEAMEFFSSEVRHKGKTHLYGLTVGLYAVSLLAIAYYGFMDPDAIDRYFNPDGSIDVAKSYYLAWFCYPRIVGWGWTIFGVAALIHVVYCMLSVTLQFVRELMEKAGCEDSSDWRGGVWIWLIGSLCWAVAYFFNKQELAAWIIIVYLIVNVLYAVCSIAFYIVKGRKPLYTICAGVLFYVGMLYTMILAFECVRVTYAIVLPLLLLFNRARSYKVEKKKRQKELANTPTSEGSSKVD